MTQKLFPMTQKLLKMRKKAKKKQKQPYFQRTTLQKQKYIIFFIPNQTNQINLSNPLFF
jgi:hypothetical protein